MISVVISVNMKTLWLRQRWQEVYILPRYCAIKKKQLSPLKVYVYTSALLPPLNRRSLVIPLIAITGSSEPLTDTCWGPWMTRAPKNLITTMSHIWENETGYSVLHHLHYIPHCVTVKGNEWSPHFCLKAIIIKDHNGFISCEVVTCTQLLRGIQACSKIGKIIVLLYCSVLWPCHLFVKEISYLQMRNMSNLQCNQRWIEDAGIFTEK